VRTGESELLSAVNDALDKIIEDGRYARLYAQWLKKPVTPEELKELEAVRGQGTAVTAQATGSSFRLRGDVLRAAVPLLVRGAGITLLLTCLALLFGIPLGLLIALGRLSGIRLLSLLLTVYVEVLRGTPLLMQVFVIYFVLPAAGVQVPQFAAGVIALSLNAAAYISEIFRAGIESIDRGQMEAARSLGMDYRCAMRWVILPQTLRRVLPPLTNEAVALLKDTSIVSIISITELSRAGREQASNSGAPVTIVVAVAALYLVMTLPLTQLVRWLEVQWQPISRPRPEKRTTP
jgi:His/Glu/Gln/Arg/opine family amino acid ABC transporter permease subunit